MIDRNEKLTTMQPVSTPVLLTVRAIAKMLSLGESTVYAMLANGELPYVAIGRSKRVALRDVETWIAKSTVRGGE